jgi:hypothetical protein
MALIHFTNGMQKQVSDKDFKIIQECIFRGIKFQEFYDETDKIYLMINVNKIAYIERI